MPGHPDPHSHPPGPPPRGKGLIRNLLYYRNFATDPFAFVGDRFNRYGDIYRAVNPDGSSLYVLRKAEHCREVLATKASHYRKTHSAFEQLTQVLGSGLLTTDGDTWKRQRRLVQPAFHPDKLREYSDAMVDEAQSVAKLWSHPHSRDVSEDMMKLTMRIVARTLFSHRVESESEKVGRAMMELQASFSSPARFLPEWLPMPARKRAERALADLDGVIYGLIDQRRSESNKGHRDLLQALLDAVDDEGDGKGLSQTELRDQLMTLFLAGHETTSNALTWTLYLLSQNPSAYESLQQEVDEVLGTRPVTFEDLDQMPYGDQVIREAMRLYPPVTALARKAEVDTTIADYSVAAGSEVVLWVWFAHRDPEVFPQPERFRPERFNQESRERIPKMAYLPFGGGPRLCVGHGFATLEARLILATLVQCARVRLVPGHRVVPQPRITLGAKYGMHMKIEPRSAIAG